MATIATRVFGDGTSTLFTLFNDEFVRTLGFSNGWSKIRISMLCAVQSSGNVSLSQNMGMGLCTGNATIGNTAGFKSASTTNWTGLTFVNTSFGATAGTFNAGPPAYMSYSIISISSKRGASTISQQGTGVSWFVPQAGSGNRGFVICDITKGATYTVGAILPALAGTAQLNHTMADLLEASEQIKNSTAVMKGVTNSALISNIVTGGEDVGLLDTLSIYWANAATPLEVYGIVVRSIYTPTTS